LLASNESHDPTLEREAIENSKVDTIGHQRYLAPVVGHKDTVFAHTRMPKRNIPVVQRYTTDASEDTYAAGNRSVLISDRRYGAPKSGEESSLGDWRDDAGTRERNTP